MFLSGVREYEEADSILRELVAVSPAAFGEDSFRVGIHWTRFGSNLMWMKRYQEAEEALLQGRAILERALPEGHTWRAASYGFLRTLYRMWNKPEEAAVYTDLLAGE